MHRNGGLKGVCVGRIRCIAKKTTTKIRENYESRALRILVTDFRPELMLAYIYSLTSTIFQKNVGLKSFLKDTHGSQSKAKRGPCNLKLPDKELPQKTIRNLTHSSSKAISSTKSQLTHVEKANSGLEMVLDRLHSFGIKDEYPSYS
ncbi:hypothetical protein L2E82_38035 [Cichorium intybus]|uniref:Uncharacterized protein n=1 Tax=Cichorium intybus TaxID=13427 RepID=A0ACB9AGP2_CICIN|nr:hypothetical protein L2E82_38035 [Cichorium intybus]